MNIDEARSKVNEISVPDEEILEEEATVNTEESTAPVEAENTTEDESTEDETKEEDPEAEATVEQDPPRVPYSRFETVNEERIALKERLRLLEEEKQQIQLDKAATKGPDGLPEYWTKLYGDSDASKEAFALRQQELADIRESLKENVRNDIIREQVESEKRTEELVDDWTDKIDDYAATHKRRFSDSETDALLDVMDELTPKDEDGNYIVEPIQYLPKAVELYDLRQEKALASKKTSKQLTTKLTSAKSEGSLVTPTAEWDGDWRKKLARMGGN